LKPIRLTTQRIDGQFKNYCAGQGFFVAKSFIIEVEKDGKVFFVSQSGGKA
jgi:hypothetical protein